MKKTTAETQQIDNLSLSQKKLFHPLELHGPSTVLVLMTSLGSRVQPTATHLCSLH